MKSRFTMLIIVGVVIMLFIGIAYHDHEAHQTTVTKATQSLSQLQAEVDAQRKSNDQFITEYNALWDECEKSVVNYNLVPIAARTQARMPNCGLSITQ